MPVRCDDGVYSHGNGGVGVPLFGFSVFSIFLANNSCYTKRTYKQTQGLSQPPLWRDKYAVADRCSQ